MFDFNKMVNGGEDIVCCYYCGGKGWVVPKTWMAVTPPPPHKCSVCNGNGDVKVVTNRLW
jgi:DnaJ-class molecular chaperone